MSDQARSYYTSDQPFCFRVVYRGNVLLYAEQRGKAEHFVEAYLKENPKDRSIRILDPEKLRTESSDVNADEPMDEVIA